MRFRIWALLLGVLATPASAQPRLPLHGAGGAPSAAAPAYTGPGDVVASATAWYGLRGYSAAYAATGTGNAVNVRRASDNAAQDIVILTTGALDVASYNTFVGTDATASCTLSGTTGACSGASATIHINDPVTGVGLTQPCIVATASQTAPVLKMAGTASTTCGTVGAAVTFTFQVAGFIPTEYDQSGANFCSAAPCNVVQATAGNQPQILPLCANSGTLPCMFNSLSTQTLAFGNVTPASGTMTFSIVANKISGTNRDIFIRFGGSGGGNNCIDIVAANSWRAVGGGSGTISAAANDNIAHAAQAVLNNAASFLTIDGTDTSGTLGGDTSANPLAIVSANVTPFYQMEAGVWMSTAFTGTQRTNSQLNQKAYWGTP